MLINQRIIFSDNNVMNDLSIALNDFRTASSTIPFVAAEDELYIASYLPFNSKYIEIDTANTNTSTIQIAVWWGNVWKDAVDVIDETSVGGKSLAQSGYIRFKPNRLYGWSRDLDSEDVDGVSTIGIYNMFWLRVKFSANLSLTTALKYIGHKFNTDSQLYSFYPDLNQTALKESFAAGKTTWNEQSYMASEIVVSDLTKKNIIKSSDQILNHELYLEAACHKVAEIVYSALGKPYEDDEKGARKKYLEEINKGFHQADLDQDGSLSTVERNQRAGYLTR